MYLSLLDAQSDTHAPLSPRFFFFQTLQSWYLRGNAASGWSGITHQHDKFDTHGKVGVRFGHGRSLVTTTQSQGWIDYSWYVIDSVCKVIHSLGVFFLWLTCNTFATNVQMMFTLHNLWSLVMEG
jgi:hypothetical protein